MAGLIGAVLAHSIAEELELSAGDSVLAVNGQPVEDLIDYDFLCAGETELTLLVAKADGETWEIELEKEPDEDLGLVFTASVFDRIRPCRNHCLFCFIDQLQPQPRPSLLVKDDDYRMSFLEGNFITGTNLREQDFERIERLRLSPLYVSVHTTDEALRTRMLGCHKAVPALPLLRRLIACGAKLHTQIVLCPDINDGVYLERTLADLAALFPAVASIAVVPLGLTRYQTNPQLRLYTPQEARQLLAWLAERQAEFRSRFGTSLVFAADELYVKAGLPFPQAGHYENFDQIENGVGMAAHFLQGWQKLRPQLPRGLSLPRTALVTGVNGYAVMQELMADLRAAAGPAVELLRLENRFYGPPTTATGLLTGTCLLAGLPVGQYDRYLIPDNMLKFGEELFLDDLTVTQVAERLKTPITVVENNAAGLFTALFGAPPAE